MFISQLFAEDKVNIADKKSLIVTESEVDNSFSINTQVIIKNIFQISKAVGKCNNFEAQTRVTDLRQVT